MARSLSCFLVLFFLAAVGCRHECGERPHLFPRLHERLNLDGNHGDANSSRSNGSGKDCGPEGHPVSRSGGAGFGGEVIYTGPAYPSGQPYIQPGNSRPDELPQPGGYITPPGVPNAPQRPVDSRLQPKTSGGTMTGDPRK